MQNVSMLQQVLHLEPLNFKMLFLRVEVTSTLKMEAEIFSETLTSIFLLCYNLEDRNFNFRH